MLAVWLPMNTEELSIKAFNAGYPYTEKGLIRRSDLVTPITRYAKNYTHSKRRYSLCIISQEQNIAKMEAWLDEQSDHIRPKDLSYNFKLLDIHYEG